VVLFRLLGRGAGEVESHSHGCRSCNHDTFLSQKLVNRKVELCSIQDIYPYPHVRPVMVPGVGHWIQYEFPEVVVEESLKRVAELDDM
jgi:pimeloyl-ACP methyl ester carboxylesterase